MFTPPSIFCPQAFLCLCLCFPPQHLELSVFQATDPPLLLYPVSEDEVKKEADNVGLARGEHVEDLLRALTGCTGQKGEQQRNGGHGAEYSFSITPDHGRLSYQKISNGVPVSKKTVGDPWHMSCLLSLPNSSNVCSANCQFQS